MNADTDPHSVRNPHLLRFIWHDPSSRTDPLSLSLRRLGPKGEPVTVKLFPQASGDYTGEFSPAKVGQHRIDVTFANQTVQGSPFFTEVYDPAQVRIGPLPRDMMTGSENTFEIHLDNAGNVPLEVKITSPTGINGEFNQ
jgi:hypothetical protein